MSSSEDGFTWLTASESDIMSSNDSNASQNDSDPETPKSYKAKLKKQERLNKSIDNHSDNTSSENIYKKKSKKRKIKDEPPDSVDTSTRKKKIKIEPESDLDTDYIDKNKKPRKHLLQSEDSIPIGIHDLNNKNVKKEVDLLFLKPETPQIKSPKKLSDTLTSSAHSYNEDDDGSDRSFTKKKKKKGKRSHNYNEEAESDKYENTNHEVNKLSKRPNDSFTSSAHSYNEEVDGSDRSFTKKTKKKANRSVTEEVESDKYENTNHDVNKLSKRPNDSFTSSTHSYKEENDESERSFTKKTKKKAKRSLTEKTESDKYENTNHEVNKLLKRPNDSFNSSVHSYNEEDYGSDRSFKKKTKKKAKRSHNITKEAESHKYENTNHEVIKYSDSETSEKEHKKNKRISKASISDDDISNIKNESSSGKSDIDEISVIAHTERIKNDSGMDYSDNSISKENKKDIQSNMYKKHDNQSEESEVDDTVNTEQLTDNKPVIKEELFQHSDSDNVSLKEDTVHYEVEHNYESEESEVDDTVNTEQLTDNKPVIKEELFQHSDSDNVSLKEDTVHYEVEHNYDNESMNAHFNNYLKINHNLKEITKKILKGAVITDDDELIYQIMVPSEIKIETLEDALLTVDKKCKIKVNDETFVGKVEERGMNYVNLMLSDNNSFFIRKLETNGTIQLHKRIPKQRYLEDNMSSSQGSYIPLPVTKSRHPLFGPNYKAAMKLSKSVKEQLQEADSEPVVKKKKKKDKIKRENNSPEDEIEATDETITKKKNKKKRKLSDQDTYRSNAKKSKYNPDSAEAWESERAIEENLFN